MSIANAWSDVIRANWATCQLFIDLRTGGYQDLSDNARVVTLTNAAVGRTPQWPSQTEGKGLDVGGVAGGNGYLSTPHAAALNLNPSGTIIAFARTEFGLGTGGRIAWKRTGGVSSYDFYESVGGYTTGVLGLYDGAAAHSLGGYSLSTMRSVCASFTVGAVPWGYANGVRLAVPVSVWNPGVDGGPLYLANTNAGGAGQPGMGWRVFLLFSTRLSGAEISQLHNDFMESAHYL